MSWTIPSSVTHPVETCQSRMKPRIWLDSGTVSPFCWADTDPAELEISSVSLLYARSDLVITSWRLYLNKLEYCLSHCDRLNEPSQSVQSNCIIQFTRLAVIMWEEMCFHSKRYPRGPLYVCHSMNWLILPKHRQGSIQTPHAKSNKSLSLKEIPWQIQNELSRVYSKTDDNLITTQNTMSVYLNTYR